MRMLGLSLKLGIAGIFLVGCSGTDAAPAASKTTSAGAGGGTSAGAGGSTSTGAGGGATTGTGGSDMTPISTSSKVAVNGIITSTPWVGAGFTAAENGTVAPDCTSMTSCIPAFAGDMFCMTGKVTGKADYSGFAMLGWNVNQPADAMPATWAIPATGGLTVTVANQPATTALRVQIQGVDPKDPAGRWCAALTSGKPILWSDFKTNCWTGGKPQTAIAPGTMIQQASITVPGLLVDLPFNVCLTDLTIQP